MERRQHPRMPIRLKVSYRSAESLVTEYTTCVSKGGCALVSERPLDPGTRFVFEMYAHGHQAPLEIEGEVVRINPLGDDAGYEIGIKYVTAGPQREVLDDLLSQIMIDPTYQVVRRHARIPVNLIAHDADRIGRYLIRDLSRGGMRIEGKSISNNVAVGTRVALGALVGYQTTPFILRGTVVWVHRGTRQVRTRLGVRFDTFDDAELMVLDGMTRLLRPKHLELTFSDRPGESVRMAKGSQTLRRLRTVPETSELIQHVASGYLTELPGLELTPLEAVLDTGSAHTDIIRVGFVGDVDGEIVVETSLELGARIASQTVGDTVQSGDRSMISDALTEMATALAGVVCDRLDEHGVELEVTAPLPGVPRIGSQDHVTALAFGGSFGRVVLSIITREVSPSAWPV
ncbi:MAG: PilZ domain-containing protein [Kofleriaceae bacterium]